MHKLFIFHFLLCVAFVSAFWFYPTKTPGQVEWNYPRELLYPMAKHILAYHQNATLGRQISCNLSLAYQAIIIRCPPDEKYQPPSREEANKILLAMPKPVEHYRKVQRYYRNVNEETRNILLALWNQCQAEPATWEQIIEAMPD